MGLRRRMTGTAVETTKLVKTTATIKYQACASGIGIRVWGLGSRVSGLGFRV